MSEQKNFTLDDLLEGSGLNLGGGEPDFDPFAQSDGVNADDVPAQPQDRTAAPCATQPDSEESLREGAGGQEIDAGVDAAGQPETVTPPPAVKAPAPPSNVTAPDFNPLAAAVSRAEEQNVKAGAAGVLAKPPVFTYGSAKENITDKTQTFEQLRAAKSEDFPELGASRFPISQ